MMQLVINFFMTTIFVFTLLSIMSMFFLFQLLYMLMILIYEMNIRESLKERIKLLVVPSR